MSRGETALEVQGLRLTLEKPGARSRPLVEDVNLTVMRGRVTGLVGESGCGKSLTCLALMDLLPRAVHRRAGRIVLGGERLEGLPPARWRCFRGRRAAMILQNPMTCFDPIFTIGRHISETLAAHGRKETANCDRVKAVLVEVGFEQPAEILTAYPFQLSGGMLQRVMVSLALLLDAELIIADEPTTDLDVIVQSRILDFIDRLRRTKNIGVLIVTHDLSVIARLADELAVMKNGSVIESGPVNQIYTRPKHSYTKALLGAHFSLYGLMADSMKTKTMVRP